MHNLSHKHTVLSSVNLNIRRLFVIALTSISFASTSVSADENTISTSNDTSSDKHWSFGSAIGDAPTDLTVNKVAIEPEKSVKVKTINLEENNMGWKFNLGVDVTSNLAIEAGYVDMNKDAEINPVVTDPAIFSNMGSSGLNNAADGFTLGSVYRYNITDQIGLTGSVGVFNWEGDLINQSLNGSATNGETGGTDIYFGLGGGYRLTEDVSLSIEWEHYEFNNDDTDTLSIGVSYHFK